MKNYGLTDSQIKKAKDKINFNKEFMQNNGIHLDNKIVPFADFVANSYINADRYIAELQHRAWSVYEYAKEKDLKNIFITLTLPSHWHKQKTFKNRLVTNKKYSGRKYIATINKVKFLNCHVIQRVPLIEPLLDFTNTIDKFTPHNASKELSKMLKQLFNERSYRSINNDDRCYFRVTEPHKDGTPHVHMSLFVPADKVQSIVNSISRLFPAPLSKIETNVESPVKYLMKYVLKTLDDLREDTNKISNLTLWYLYHGISRFYTSRTFVALEVYRKLNGMYSLRDLSKCYNCEDLHVYIDTTTKKIAKIDNEHGTIYTHKPVNWSEKLADYTYLEAEYEPLFKEKIKKSIDLIIDGEQFLYFNGIYTKNVKKPYQMNNIELYEYYQNINIEIVDLNHYGNTKNILIDRGLIDEPKVNLAAYQDDFFKFKSEVF